MTGNPVLKVISVGLGVTLQDRGRPGWRRFGVPTGGVMDPEAAQCANRLLDNPASCAVLEILGSGARFEVLEDHWIALCGAGSLADDLPVWRAHRAQRGTRLSVVSGRDGLWTYLAMEGGFAAPLLFGSRSYYQRGELGRRIEIGSSLALEGHHRFQLAPGVIGRTAGWEDRRDYGKPPRIRIYPGPQWSTFTPADQDRLVGTEWKLSPMSDRVGYRLEGGSLHAQPSEIYSEPVRVGSIQVPESGCPIITMPDGPTVGGYPKIAWVDLRDLPWVTQTRPGQIIRFALVPC